MQKSKIDIRADKLRKKGQTIHGHPPQLDYAQMVAQRRANRVGGNRQLELNNFHFYSSRKSVEMENQSNERARMEDRLRIGALPASITHPIAAEMMRRAAAPVVAMEVDEPETQVVVNHNGATYQTETRGYDRKTKKIPNLKDYDTDENKLIRRRPNAPGVAPYIPDPAVARSLNIKIRARNEQYTLRMARKAAGQPENG